MHELQGILKRHVRRLTGGVLGHLRGSALDRTAKSGERQQHAAVGEGRLLAYEGLPCPTSPISLPSSS
jgi:hypothetical protein